MAGISHLLLIVEVYGYIVIIFTLPPLNSFGNRRGKWPTSSNSNNPATLSDRELEVLRLVAQGLSNPEIAKRLILSRRTVDAHLRSIYNKLEVNSRFEASRIAAENNLL